MNKTSKTSRTKSSERPATVPGIYKYDTKMLHRCHRNSSLLAAAIARYVGSDMEVNDHTSWKTICRRRTRDCCVDDLKMLLESSEVLDVYWVDDRFPCYGRGYRDGRTMWRIVRRKRVDGMVQVIVFPSAPIDELKAMAQAAILSKSTRRAKAPASPAAGPRRL